MAGKMVAPGVTTDEIDQAVHKMIIEAGAYPSPLNYGERPHSAGPWDGGGPLLLNACCYCCCCLEPPLLLRVRLPARHPALTCGSSPTPRPPAPGKFPKSVCTSVNECICHGIPDSRPLRDGDIVNIDVTVYLDVRGCRGGEGQGGLSTLGRPLPAAALRQSCGQQRGRCLLPAAMWPAVAVVCAEAPLAMHPLLDCPRATTATPRACSMWATCRRQRASCARRPRKRWMRVGGWRGGALG